MNIDYIEIARWINLTLAIIVTGVWIYFYRKYKEPISIVPLTWLVNVIAYYVFRLFYLGFGSAIKNTYFLNLWSSLLHTHAIILLGGAAIVGIYKFEKYEECIKKIRNNIKSDSKEAK